VIGEEPAIKVERLDGDVLVLDGLGLARAFFAGGSSSSAEALGRSDRVELDDVIAMNRSMRSRSPHHVWTAIVESETPWLAALPGDLDLLATGDARWKSVRADDLIRDALAAVIGDGRGPAVATKLLHLKRPRLFPMLDQLVAEMLGANAADLAASDRRVDAAAALALAIRREGRRNLPALRAIQRTLADEGAPQTLVRLFDAILWLAHPAARVGAGRRTLEISAQPVSSVSGGTISRSR
jgi:hypothetical protein